MIFYLAIALFVGIVFYVISHQPGTADESDSVQGGIAQYFVQISRLQNQGHDSFFVTAMASDQTRFVQVSANKSGGAWTYQFDMPVTDWSRNYAATIQGEAEKRGLETRRVNGTVAMQFLDVDFGDRARHDTFVIWVIEDVFGLPKDETFDITWG
ncbi:MAG: hypothetical protein HKN27_05770 [Silicimonas sp.]|nr:hypothetical protein [Silicimonas sp.]